MWQERIRKNVIDDLSCIQERSFFLKVIMATVIMILITSQRLRLPNGHEIWVTIASSITIAIILISMSVISKDRHKYLVLNKYDVWLLIFLLYILIRNSISVSLFDWDSFLKILSLVGVYILLKESTYKNFIIIVSAIIVSGIVQSIIALLQLVSIVPSNHSNFLVTGSFDNPALLGLYIAAIIPILLWLLINKHLSILRIIFYGGLLLMIMALAASGSRSAWLGCIASSLLIIARSNVRKDKFYKFIPELRFGRIVKTFIVIAGLAMFGYMMYEFKPTSANSRLFIWAISLRVFFMNPIWGVGKSFSYEYMSAQSQYLTTHPLTPFMRMADNIHHSYNEFIQISVQYGLVGLLIFIMILYLIISKRCEGLIGAFKYALIGVVLAGMSSYAVSSYSLLLIVFMYLGIVCRKHEHSSDYKNVGHCHVRHRTALHLFGIPLLLTGSAYTISIFYWNLALKHISNETSLEYLKYSNIASIMLNSDGYFLNSHGKCLNLQKEYTKSNSVMSKARKIRYSSYSEILVGDNYLGLQEYNKADKAYSIASNLVPTHMYPLYKLAKCQFIQGDTAMFIKTADKIASLPIKVNTASNMQMLDNIARLRRSISK